MAIQATRTYVGSIQNQQQVYDGLDSLGDSLQNLERRTMDNRPHLERNRQNPRCRHAKIVHEEP